MSEKESNYSSAFGGIGTIFLAWVLTYFISGPPHWMQVFLFWMWVVPLLVLVVILAVIGLVFAATA